MPISSLPDPNVRLGLSLVVIPADHSLGFYLPTLVGRWQWLATST